MSDAPVWLTEQVEAGRDAAIRADERQRCIAAVEALLGAPIDPPFGLSESDGPGAWYAAIREAVAALRSLSPLGLPTTERER